MVHMHTHCRHLIHHAGIHTHTYTHTPTHTSSMATRTPPSFSFDAVEKPAIILQMSCSSFSHFSLLIHGLSLPPSLSIILSHPLFTLSLVLSLSLALLPSCPTLPHILFPSGPRDRVPVSPHFQMEFEHCLI